MRKLPCTLLPFLLVGASACSEAPQSTAAPAATSPDTPVATAAPASSASAAPSEGMTVGALAPDFELPGSDGNNHRLSDYRGQHVVLAFFPKAFTGG